MTTMALEEPDGGLGSCQAAAPSRPADSSSWPHDSQEPEPEGSPAGRVDTRPKKTEKDPVAKVAPGPSKEKLKAGATPRSPTRKKVQAAPPLQPPPPPPAPSEELPWGDLSLNKCLVLASLVALLGSAFQLCRDVVVGEVDSPSPVPEPWVPLNSAPKKPASPPLEPMAGTPACGPPAPQVQAEKRTEVLRSAEAIEKEEGDPGEGAGEERAPIAHEGPKESLQKERALKERPRKERPRKERQRKEERQRREERPRKPEKPREDLPRRWKAREGDYRPWVRDSRDPEHRKRQAWASPRRPNAEDWPPGRQKHRAGKGRD